MTCERKDLLKQHRRLKNRAQQFMNEYESLCRKYKLFVDGSCGYASLTSGSLGEITTHIREVCKMVDTDLAVLESAGNLVCGRAPLSSD